MAQDGILCCASLIHKECIIWISKVSTVETFRIFNLRARPFLLLLDWLAPCHSRLYWNWPSEHRELKLKTALQKSRTPKPTCVSVNVSGFANTKDYCTRRNPARDGWPTIASRPYSRSPCIMESMH